MGDNLAFASITVPSIGDMEAAKSLHSMLMTRFAVVATLAVAMLAAGSHFWPSASFWQQQRLAKKLVSELEQAAHPRIQVVLKQVNSLGNPAIEALVIAAASERADIALAARRVIEENMAAWQIQSGQDKQFTLAEPISFLAAALAKHIDEFGAFGEQWATHLTLDIVDLADDFSVETALPVLADCSSVLSRTPALAPRMLTPDQFVQPSEPTQIVATLPEVRVPALPSEQLNSSQNRPTAGLPPGRDKTAEDSRASQELLRSTELPRNSDWVPEWTTQPNTPTEAKPNITAQEAQPHTTGEDVVDLPSPEEQGQLIESLQPLETRELLAQLRAADPFKIAAIREVLVARGIATEELALAAKLFAEDKAERLKLVDDLKVLPARTARRWLRELLIDKDAEVRLHALTALATTNDPELRSIARDLVVHDTDRRVVEVASQIMRERR